MLGEVRRDRCDHQGGKADELEDKIAMHSQLKALFSCRKRIFVADDQELEVAVLEGVLIPYPAD